jgi:hypothetical protein
MTETTVNETEMKFTEENKEQAEGRFFREKKVNFTDAEKIEILGKSVYTLIKRVNNLHKVAEQLTEISGLLTLQLAKVELAKKEHRQVGFSAQNSVKL